MLPRARPASAGHDARRGRRAALPTYAAVGASRSSRLCRVCRVTLLSHLSPDGDGLPQAADARRLALGFEAWTRAVAGAAEDPRADAARRWSAAPPGRRLLGAIFGNSPFLSGGRGQGMGIPDPPCRGRCRPALRRDCRMQSRLRADLGEDTAALMRRLRNRQAAASPLSPRWPNSPASGRWKQQTAGVEPFAEAAIGAALAPSVASGGAHRRDPGLPSADEPERDSGLIVLGMGKLGGHELNYSSDIDLILLYDASAGAGDRTRRHPAVFRALGP